MINAARLPPAMLLPRVVIRGLLRDLSFCCLLLQSGCSLFTSTQKSNLLNQTNMENTSALQHLDLAQSETALHSLLLQSDTSHQDFNVEIWPRGRFSFSPGNGFEGEAEKIRYHGTARQSSALTLEKATQTTDVRVNDMQLKQAATVTSKTEVVEKISKPALQWLVTIFLFLCSCAILWYSRGH
jgi:hypothetical protein